MKAIEIDDDLYQFLLQQSARIGETATELLNRLLGRSTRAGGEPPGRGSRGLAVQSLEPEIGNELSECLRSPTFLAKREAVGRVLRVLSYAHERDPEGFKKVLAISGRSRKYFAITKQELLQSGRSVQPRRVPGTNYWFVTNNDTPKKARILADVLRLLGYSDAAIEAAKSAICSSF